jgi:hypothetical protein
LEAVFVLWQHLIYLELLKIHLPRYLRRGCQDVLCPMSVFLPLVGPEGDWFARIFVLERAIRIA